MADLNMFASLPPEYQAEVQKILRQRRMAEAMQMQALQPAGPTQTIGGYAVKQNPLASALQAFTGIMAGKRLEEGDKSLGDIMTRANTATTEEINKLLAAPDPRTGLSSANPRVAALAQALMKQRAEQGAKVAEVTKDSDPATAVAAAMGNLPQPGYAPPKPGPIEFGMQGDHPYSIVPQPGGKRDLKYAPKGQSITIENSGENAARKALGGKVPDVLEGARGEAIKANEAIVTAQDTIRLAKDPSVITGFAAGPQMGIAALAAKLGFGGQDAVAKTQALLSNLAANTLEASKDLKGAISDKEKPFLEEAKSGRLAYTPEALQHLAALSIAVNHNRLLRAKTQWEGAANVPGAEQGRGMYPFPGINHTLPEGFDFTEGPQGSIRYNGGLFNPVGPTPVQAPNLGGGGQKPVSQMTPQEIQAEIDALKKRLGR